jgi:hypothetical protein
MAKVCTNPEECCRELSRVWEALGVEYNGRSASENIRDLKQQLDVLQPGGLYAWKSKYEALAEALKVECTCRVIEKCLRCEAIDALEEK